MGKKSRVNLTLEKQETKPDNEATHQEQKRPESEGGKGSGLVVLSIRNS